MGVKDGSTGFVTMQSNQGTTYFSPFTAYAAFMQNLEKAMNATQTLSTEASEFINSKHVELREVKQGPLAEAKAELAKLRPKVSVIQSKLDQLKKRVEDGKRAHAQREEFER